MEQEQGCDRLYFATVETLAGSRSQGWHGILYAANGTPIVLAPGEVIETRETTGGMPFERFVGVAAVEPWQPFGAIPDVLMQDNSVANNPMNCWWHYQIWVEDEGTRSAASVGILLLDGKEVMSQTPTETIKTAMGEFAFHASETPFGPRGWYPKRW